MSEGAGSRSGDGAMEFWREWYDANARAWSGVLGGDKETLADPFGLYRQWFNVLDDTKRPAEDAAAPQDTHQQWVEATTEAWYRAAELSKVLVGLAPRWVEMAEALQEQMLDPANFPTDPLDFYQRWYNATSGPLSKMAKDVLESEAYLGEARRFFEAYATLEGAFQRAAERYFSNLQLSTRSDSTRIAELVVGLEDKVDRIEETFEEFEYGFAKPATAEAVEALERKLDENRSDLGRVEDKLDRLLAALDADGPRTEPSDGEIDATGAARRKARDLGVDLGGVRGSGAGGRITVEDVRREGEG